LQVPAGAANHHFAADVLPALSTAGDVIVKTPWLLGLFGLGLAALWQPALRADDAWKPGANPDVLAKKLVAQCARVKDGDIVQVSGGIEDVALLESITVEAAKLGADPFVTLSPSERTVRRFFTEVPAKFDSRPSSMDLKLAETITVMLTIDRGISAEVLAGIPPERLHARTEAGMPAMQTLMKRNVRRIHLGNGLYPTETRAKQLGLTKAELAKQFHDALNVDYDQMQAAGEAARKALAAGKRAHITTSEGTDLFVDIADRATFVSDGVLSDDKLKKGGPACQVWLPAGEVYLAPVPGTAEGKVVVERMPWEGGEIRGLSLTFKKGKLTQMKAASGLERLQAQYDAASAGKDDFGFFEIGINPAVRMPKNGPAVLFMEAGIITVGMGNNVWAGGENKSSFDFVCTLRGGTLQIDGKALVQDDSLQTGR
jgi:leucyl aminopeptidase (aminopeptidase T)